MYTMKIKDAAKKAIDSLPDDTSIDDIIHALYVNAKFHHGEKEIRDGKGIAHEDAKLSSTWPNYT